MYIATCSKCHRMFESNSETEVCPDCYKLHEEEFKVIRSYIRENPNANIIEVSEACKVTISQIRRWIKEERISYKEEIKIGIECERCGKRIKIGRYCSCCETDLLKTYNSVYQHTLPSSDFNIKDDNTNMRFLNQKKKGL